MTIPYFSQWDEDANERSADCGQVCVKMLAASVGVDVRTNELTFQTRANGTSSGLDLIKNFKLIGLDADYHVREIEGIQLGDICLVNYGQFMHKQDMKFNGLHWLVYINRDVWEVTTHDPDYFADRRDEGENKKYPLNEWNKAFEGTFIRMTSSLS